MTARRPHLLATALLLGAGAAVPAVELDGLVKNSPFGQAAERTVIGEAKPGTLEFRGLYVDKGVTYFSVYNSITKQSAWIAEGARRVSRRGCVRPTPPPADPRGAFAAGPGFWAGLGVGSSPCLGLPTPPPNISNPQNTRKPPKYTPNISNPLGG